MKVKFFQDLGVRNDGIAKMLVKFPTLLTYSLYKKIRPVVCLFFAATKFVTIKLFFGNITTKFITLITFYKLSDQEASIN